MTDEQFVAIAGLLTAIRDALVPAPEPPATDPPTCAHPEEARVSFATLGDPQHWLCRLCRHENRGVPVV